MHLFREADISRPEQTNSQVSFPLLRTLSPVRYVSWLHKMAVY